MSGVSGCTGENIDSTGESWRVLAHAFATAFRILLDLHVSSADTLHVLQTANNRSLSVAAL